MLPGIPKISVLVICYNQEKVISRAIESLLVQKDYIYEICVSDDCSKDRTWEILQEYDKKYPGLFKLNRNEPNVGIFENIEKTWEMPTGDIIYRLAGDDECGEGWFEKVINFIKGNKIDYQNELFCIYGDYSAKYPNGDSFLKKKKIVNSETDLMRLSIRGLFGNRSACYSKKILDKFQKVSQGRSYIAESAQDRQLQLFTEKNYYIPFVGNVYYTQIGINIHFNKGILMQREEVELYAKNFLESHGYKFLSKDLKYIEYKTAVAMSYKNHSLKHKLKILLLFLQSIDIRLGLLQINIKRYLFAIARRVPHKKPILWEI